jgi:tetratricopeptide (TPR) repeat protein
MKIRRIEMNRNSLLLFSALSFASLSVSFLSASLQAQEAELNNQAATAQVLINTIDSELLSLQHQWAKTNYELSDNEQETAFDQLSKTAKHLTEQYSERAEFWVWQGIIQSSYAGAKGGLGALSLAKAAKKSFEQAMQIDPTVLDGSVYTSLGTLYHKVPGWPLGFGDDDEARELLSKAIKINPQGIDPNYFYGEFLYDKRQYADAQKHLQLALNAPLRMQRPLADASRRVEIQNLLAKVNKKMGIKS